MNFLIIGLGNFGSSLARRLTQLGHEVIGVDKRMDRVELYKDDITDTMKLDCTDPHSAKTLPVSNADVVVICIGEEEGDSIMTTALMKQLKAKRIISRAVSTLQETVIQAMEVAEVIHPERDSAEKLAKTLTTEGYIDAFELSDEYSIVKAKVPQRLEGKVLKDLNLRQEFNLTILTTLKEVDKRNIIGLKRRETEVNEVANADTVLRKGEVLVIFGQVQEIERFLEGE
jgi:trk system potassium uptake protein TrkA